MSLRDEIELYTKLSGNDGYHTSISVIGAYLDGYERRKEQTMSRYINYDAINYKNYKMHDKSSDFIDGVVYMAQRIEEAPSIDIVRCKECRYWQPHTQCGFDYDDGVYNDYCGLLTPDDDFYAIKMNADDFCSCGERKTEEEFDSLLAKVLIGQLERSE